MFATILLTIYALCAPAAGQDFLIPSNWRKPTSNLSRDVREGLAHAVVDSVSGLFNSTSGMIDVLESTTDPTMNPADQSAYLLAAISRTDYFSGNTTFQSVVVNNLNAAFQLNSRISTLKSSMQTNNNPPIAWGLAAINAYRAYNDTRTLNYAIAMWNQTLPYQIQPSDVARGRDQIQNVTLNLDCSGGSVVGGVFGGMGDSTPNVPAESVAAFMTLSAQLYEATGDNQYLIAASSAAEFTQAHLYNSSIIQDTFLVDSCQFAAITAYSYGSGFTIWGLSVLATHNQSWTPFLLSLISTTIPHSGWTNSSDGIIIEDISSPNDTLTNNILFTLRTILVRGLHEAWSRMDSTSAAASFIQGYLLVQLNALLDLATVPGSNQYSASWEGPPEPVFQAWGQLSALDVLNSAFAMAPAAISSSSSSPSPTSTPTASSTSTPTHIITTNNSKVPVIAGATVGGVVFLCLCVIVLIALVLLKRRRGRTVQSSGEPVTERRQGNVVDPFPYAAPPTSERSGKDSEIGASPSLYPSHSETLPVVPYPLPGARGAPSSSSSASRGQNSSQTTGSTGVTMAEQDINDLPRAIAQLNRVLARLPAILDNDAPPRYE